MRNVGNVATATLPSQTIASPSIKQDRTGEEKPNEPAPVMYGSVAPIGEST
jgi:hypothetical protein